MDDLNSEWQHKGGTLSDKTAWKEFGLTQDEIVEAIRDGKLSIVTPRCTGTPFCDSFGVRSKRWSRRSTEAVT